MTERDRLPPCSSPLAGRARSQPRSRSAAPSRWRARPCYSGRGPAFQELVAPGVVEVLRDPGLPEDVADPAVAAQAGEDLHLLLGAQLPVLCVARSNWVSCRSSGRSWGSRSEERFSSGRCQRGSGVQVTTDLVGARRITGAPFSESLRYTGDRHR